MALLLVQHGKALVKEEDPQRGLTAEGRKETCLIADVAKNYKVQVTTIQHSGKKRARQTAEIFAEALAPPQGLVAIAGLKPMDDVAAMATTLTSGQNTMLVGHLSFMERLVSQLISGTADLTVFKFQNSGIVCLDQNPEKLNWFIKWTLMPQVG